MRRRARLQTGNFGNGVSVVIRLDCIDGLAEEVTSEFSRCFSSTVFALHASRFLRARASLTFLFFSRMERAEVDSRG